MQSAKDTFLIALRDRLAALNPNRTVAVRGALRPAVLSAEDELPMTQGDPLDCFVLLWTGESVDATEPLALHTMRCEIRYATRGSGEFSGMDRGRVLEAMDAELALMLEPRCALKMDYSVTPAAALTTQVFWSALEKGAAVVDDDRMRGSAVVQVFALEEGQG